MRPPMLTEQVCLTAITILVIILSGCGGGGSGKKSPDQNSGLSPQNVAVNIDQDNLDFIEGQQSEFVYNIPEPDAFYEEVVIDLEAMIDTVSVQIDASHSLAKALSNTAQGYVTVGSANEASTVCTYGIRHGPFEVTLDDSGQPVSIEPGSVKVDKGAMGIIYSSSTAIACLVIDAPVDATASVHAQSVAMDLKECNEEPVQMAGYWTGPYFCSDSCSGGFSNDITLQITQDGFSASYTDFEEASYNGTVCGNKFTFNGGGPGFTEEGVFTLLGNGTATKTSAWVSDDGLCQGECEDSLTLMEF